MTIDLLRVESNERVDLTDFEFLSDSIQDQEQQFIDNFLCDPAKTRKWILSGFNPDNPAGTQVRVQRGRAILATRIGGSTQYGILTTEGDAEQIIDTSGYGAGLYGIYIRFERIASEAQSRIFWNPAGDGSEYAQTINTRWTAGWSMRIESSSPGNDWLLVGQVSCPSTSVSDQREMYFEGPSPSYESGWSTDGGGVANDRDSARKTNGVRDLQTFTGAMRQCIEDIKGRGLRRWWERDIGGLNVGFDANPTEDRVAVGDANFNLILTGGDPYLNWDANDTLYYDRTANVLKLALIGADAYEWDQFAFYPSSASIDLGKAGNRFDTLFLSQAIKIEASGATTPYMSILNLDGPADLAGYILYVNDVGNLLLDNADDNGISTANYMTFLRSTVGGSEYLKTVLLQSTGVAGIDFDLLHAGGSGGPLGRNRYRMTAANGGLSWWHVQDSGASSSQIFNIEATGGSPSYKIAQASTCSLGNNINPWTEIWVTSLDVADTASIAILQVDTGASKGVQSALEPYSTSASYTLGASGKDWYATYTDRLYLSTAAGEGVMGHLYPDTDASKSIGGSARRFLSGYFEQLVRIHDDAADVNFQIGRGTTSDAQKWQWQVDSTTLELQGVDQNWANPSTAMQFLRSGTDTTVVKVYADLNPGGASDDLGATGAVWEYLWASILQVKHGSKPEVRLEGATYETAILASGAQFRISTTNSSWAEQKELLAFENSAVGTCDMAQIAGATIVFPDINKAISWVWNYDKSIKVTADQEQRGFLKFYIDDEYLGSGQAIIVPYWHQADITES
jgi:hypothetical protein